MKRINLLDENTSNKIAAGEVVERPSSVVKELIENSIDANAKNITVEIMEGGTSLIKIIDDGDGIHPEDIKKAFLPHATSKIQKAEDIFSISTLGFRGEALPSIASVSKLSIKTKVNGYDEGYELILEEGEEISFHQCGVNKGTTIEVRDIFYNIPARKKFLKSISREGSIINDIINRIALSNPNISIQLYNNGKKVLHTYGSGNIVDVIRTVYGKSISEDVLYFEEPSDLVTVYGYVGRECIARGSRNNQSIFVNGRYVKNKTLVAAVENAFKSFSTVNKFPFFTLFIEIYPDYVDVNIHPSKAEVKFKDERLIFSKVFGAVHLALKNDVFNSFKVKEEDIEVSTFNPVVEEIKFNIKEDEKEGISYIPFDSSKSTQKDEVYIPIDLKYSKEDIVEEVIREESVKIINKKIEKFPPLKIIGQFNKTYILGEHNETLYIVDQHAAHEKILFEKYLKNIEEDNLVVQPLLIPSLVELSIDDIATFEENKEVFQRAGFTLEEFGGNTLALKEVPYFCGKIDAKGLLLSILDNLKSLGSGKTTEVKYNKIATMACKAAVKGKDYLTEIEMIRLIEELRFINDPFHCPHGRPTIIKMNNYDFEKMFRRIV